MKSLKMKLILMGVFFTLFFAVNSYGQFFQKGTKLVNLGIGFGGGYGAAGLNSSVPPISGSFEVGITENIGVGGIIGYSSFGDSGLFGSDIKFNYLLFGARGAYHFPVGDKLDLYGGAMLVYNSVSVSGLPAGFPSTGSSGINIGIFAGGRYMFSESIGAFAELGYSIALINIGLTAKF